MNDSSYTLGVDPAKRKFTACLISSSREVFAPRDFECSQEGFAQLEAALVKALAPTKDPRLTVGVEASASCDDNLLAFLRELRRRLPLTLIRVDAAQVKNFSGARPSRSKTDSSDARRVAQFTRQYGDQLDLFDLDPEAQAMQRLVNERLALIQERVAEGNALGDRLIAAFPEFEQVFPDPTTQLALEVLAKIPTAAVAATTRASTLEQIQNTNGTRSLGKERAAKLVALGKVSIASATGPAEQAAMRRQVARVQLLRSQIAEIDAELDAYRNLLAAAPAAPIESAASAAAEQGAAASELAEGATGPKAPLPPLGELPSLRLLTPPEEIRLLDSIPGIGVVGASTIVARSRGISRFTSAKAVCAQLGTCPSRSQTGSSRDTASLTSRGDRITRGMLYQLTHAAIRTDPAMAFHQWHAKRKGHVGKQAVCACMNRMARLIYGVVKTRTPYDVRKAIESIERHHAALWKEFQESRPARPEKAKKKRAEALT